MDLSPFTTRGKERLERMGLREDTSLPVIASVLFIGAFVGNALAMNPLYLGDIARNEDSRGFLLNGIEPNDGIGICVFGGGDANGDGRSDVLIAGDGCFVVFGKVGGSRIELADVKRGSDGRGYHIGTPLGFAPTKRALACLGDINGDLLDDLAMGISDAAVAGRGLPGRVFVVYGKSSPTALIPTDIENTPNELGFPVDGFKLPQSFDRSLVDFGVTISGCGDIEGDGYPDLLVSADYVKALPNIQPSSWLITINLPPPPHALIDTDCLLNTGTDCDPGYKVQFDRLRQVEYGIGGCGDVNADGIPDSLLSWRRGPDTSVDYVNRAHIVFGQKGWHSADITDSLPTVEAAGFTIHGVSIGDQLGYSWGPAGDVNGDGLADIILGAHEATALGRSSSGQAYVLFGKQDETQVNLAEFVSGTNGRGFAIHGPAAGAHAGIAAAGAGDVNGDGYSDLLVSTLREVAEDTDWADTYLVLGKPDGAAVDLAEILGGDSEHGVVFLGPGFYPNQAGVTVSAAGDVNADGLPDILIGMPSKGNFGTCQPTCVGNNTPGAAYVIFSPFAAPPQAAYRAYSRAGFAPRTGIGILGDQSLSPPDSRLWIGFDAGGAADSPTSASLEQVTLARQRLVARTARVAWRLQTNRVNWTEAELHLKYVDHEIVDMNEDALKLFLASSLEGPWTEIPATLLPEMNRVVALLDASQFSAGDGWFVLSDSAPGERLAAPIDPSSLTPQDAQRAFECAIGLCPAGIPIETLDLCPQNGDGVLTPADAEAILRTYLGQVPICP